jgi:hypothetical protein
MQLIVSRDSVCAGDDGDAPHHRRFALGAGASVEDALAAVAAARYLPSIAGGMATWSAASGIPLAVLAQQWPAPRLLPQFAHQRHRLDRDDACLRLHFSYYAQRDPEQVFDVLARLRLHAE